MEDLAKTVQSFKNMKVTTSKLDRENSFELEKQLEQNGQNESDSTNLEWDQVQSPEHKNEQKLTHTNAYLQSKEAHLAVRQIQSKNDMDDIFADLDLMMFKNVNSLFNIQATPTQNQPIGLPTAPGKTLTSAPVEVNLLDPFAKPSASIATTATQEKVNNQAQSKQIAQLQPSESKSKETSKTEIQASIIKQSSNSPKSKVEVIK